MQFYVFNSVVQVMGSWLSRYLASRQQRTEKACWTISSDSCKMSRMSVRTFRSSLKRLKVHFTLFVFRTPNCIVETEVRDWRLSIT